MTDLTQSEQDYLTEQWRAARGAEATFTRVFATEKD